jgi:hypothetical protein
MDRIYMTSEGIILLKKGDEVSEEKIGLFFKLN